jgi:hypothetical protein
MMEGTVGGQGHLWLGVKKKNKFSEKEQAKEKCKTSTMHT